MAKAKARAVLVDGKPYQKKADGSLVPLKGKTDWKRLDRQTAAQTEAIAANDRDGRPMSDEEWARAEVIHPQKVPVGLKLDNDVLGWFKSQGKGYQTRINTILATLLRDPSQGGLVNTFERTLWKRSNWLTRSNRPTPRRHPARERRAERQTLCKSGDRKPAATA